MLKKPLLLLIVSAFFGLNCSAQYTDDAPDKTDTTGLAAKKSPFGKIDFKGKGVAGTEFMLTLQSNVFYAELSPFVGIKVFKPLILGAGVHGSVLKWGQQTEKYYGAYAFARLTIAGQYFLHGEFRELNGYVPGSLQTRQWVASPIAAIGMMYGPNFYMMVGLAFNADFQNINPYGNLVYRLGFYF